MLFRSEQGNYAINKEVAGNPTYEPYPSRVITGVWWPAHRLASLQKSDMVVMLSDSGSWGPAWNALGQYAHYTINRYSSNNTNRIPGMGIANLGVHNTNSNLLFCDGHCEVVHRDDYLRSNGMVYVWPK